MKNIFNIFLLTLMLLPIVWNCSVLVHYLVEHTHTFCYSDQDHQHSTVKDCQTVCQLTADNGNNHLPTEIKLFELNQYLKISAIYKKHHTDLEVNSYDFDYGLLANRISLEDIFRPPIS